VLLISNQQDTGGQGIRVVEAFRRQSPDWDVRSVAKVQTYMAYPTDLPYRRRLLDELYPQMDVIHVRNTFEDYDRLAAKFGPKPVVIHYHGTRFRGNPALYLRQQRERGAIGIVSTLDLWLIGPDELLWLPAPYSVDWLASLCPTS
jgi:hypothetical protein